MTWFRYVSLLLGSASDFCPPAQFKSLEGITQRVLTPGDHVRCAEIYTRNEPGRFPAGFLPEFQANLQRKDVLWLGLFAGDALLAFGGITFSPFIRYDHAWLLFGMVDPPHHGRGLGTAILLARVAALSRPTKPIKILMSNVGTSERFYSRFGFSSIGEFQVGHTQKAVMDHRAALLRENVWLNIRSRLLTANMPVTGLSVPTFNARR